MNKEKIAIAKVDECVKLYAFEIAEKAKKSLMREYGPNEDFEHCLDLLIDRIKTLTENE